MRTVLTVVGARPQFIKAAVLSPRLRTEFREVLVHTGQHYDPALSDTLFEELGIPTPDLNLAVDADSGAARIRQMVAGIAEAIRAHRPEVVIVYGDTDSTLAGALAASGCGVALAHVEAGLRSGVGTMPEEINRIAADHLADFCFSPTSRATANLRAEGLAGRTAQVGDVMLDLCLQWRDRLSPGVVDGLGLTPDGYAFATVHRAANTDRPARLASILRALGDLPFPVVFAVHPRTRAALVRSGLRPAAGVRVVDPVPYGDALALAGHARCVLTDSGGLQKEAWFLGTPCVTLRAETEWPETLDGGWNRLADADPESIALAATAPRPDAPRDLSRFGAGRAASRIVLRLATACGELDPSRRRG